jgi:hypothetical protein
MNQLKKYYTYNGDVVVSLEKKEQTLIGIVYVGVLNVPTKCIWTLSGFVIDCGIYKKEGMSLDLN